jgi:hypothetical protein
MMRCQRRHHDTPSTKRCALVDSRNGELRSFRPIRIETNLAPDLPSVALDRVQVQQVFVPLSSNQSFA